MTVRSNLRVLHSLREVKEKRRIMYEEIVRDSGVPHGTISSWMRGKVLNFNAHTIERLCEYYNCEPGDLIVKDESQESVA